MRQIRADGPPDSDEARYFGRLHADRTGSMVQRMEAIRWARDVAGLTPRQLEWMERSLRKLQRHQEIARLGFDVDGKKLSENPLAGSPAPYGWKKPRRRQRREVLEI